MKYALKKKKKKTVDEKQSAGSCSTQQQKKKKKSGLDDKPTERVHQKAFNAVDALRDDE